jgi:hypothetical protein
MRDQSALGRDLRRRRIETLARGQAGILSRRQVYAIGVTRWQVRAELRARRWSAPGRQTLRVLDGPSPESTWWTAILEVGPHAVLDGVTALTAAGLTGITEPEVHVAVPKSSDPRRQRGVVVHETRRYEPGSVLLAPVPRMRPSAAAVHAAIWARTDRQAELFVLAAAQQGLFTTAELVAEVAKIRRDRRRSLLRDLCEEVAGGVESMGELDFARLCAARGFPPPTRQVWRQGASGRVYLDVVWEQYGLTVEIDGFQHLAVAAWVSDALKANTVALGGPVVLRIPNIALRRDPDPFMKQVEQALRRGGWDGRRAA